MNKAVFAAIVEIFGEVIDTSGMKLETNAALGEDIPVNSSQMLRILSRIESKYQFKFEPTDILGIKTLGDILEVVRIRGRKDAV